MPTTIVTNDGTKFKSYEAWLNAVEEEYAKRASDIATELLYEAEIYMSVGNIITMLKAMEMTIGNLKTVQKSYQKIVDNFNKAAEYMDEKGVRATYEELRNKYGLDLTFDEADMNWIDDDGKEVYERLKIRIGDGNK